MTQKELLSSVSARLGWEESNVISVLEAFKDIVRQEVVAGNRVGIGEFGLFQALRHPEYILIEAEAGERYLIPPSVEVVFEAAITASDSETLEVGSALHFIPDTSFEEEANNPFALFEPTLVHEGVHFPGLAEVFVNESKAVADGTETGTEEPATLNITDTFEVSGTTETVDTSDTPKASDILKVSRTPETPQVPSIPETSEVSEPTHQQKRSSIWIPVIGGVVIAFMALLFSRQRLTEE